MALPRASVNVLRSTSSPRMPRLTVTSLARAKGLVPSRAFIASRRYFAETSEKDKGTQNSRPGWKGRHGDDHVLHRDHLDAQGKPSNQAREEKAQGQEGSNAISQKDERNSNQKAQEEHPEAPGPVIGMNSERGGKGH